MTSLGSGAEVWAGCMTPATIVVEAVVAVCVVAARAAECSAFFSASHVAGPTTPSTPRPCAAWKARIAAPVLGPSTSSTARPSIRWASRRSPKVTLP